MGIASDKNENVNNAAAVVVVVITKRIPTNTHKHTHSLFFVLNNKKVHVGAVM